MNNLYNLESGHITVPHNPRALEIQSPSENVDGS